MDYISRGQAIEAKWYLVDKANKLSSRVALIAAPIVNSEKFFLWSGSSKLHQHHYGDGGLIVHTTEVVKLCLTTNETMQYGINDELLYLAALYHDVGKMWDYEQEKIHTGFDVETQTLIWTPNGEWKGTDHKTKIYHIQRSALIWNEYSKSNEYAEFTEDETDEVLHAILAHHGQPEWCSPVKPATKMAWLLHLCDNMSARLNDNGVTK